MDATDVLLLIDQARPAPRPLWGEPRLNASSRKRSGRMPAVRRSVTLPQPSSDPTVLPTLAAEPSPKPAASAGPDPLLVLQQLAAAVASAIPPASPPQDPLAVARGLEEAARLRVWLSVAELAALLRLSVGTVRGWSSGHCPRPGVVLERCKQGGVVWWLVRVES